MSCLAARLNKVPRVPLFRRTFLTSVLPNFSSPGNDQNKVYRETKILPHGQKDLYDVVADVASYRHFLPFCTGSRIVSPPRPQALDSKAHLKPSVMEAELTVGFLAFTESYISRVICTPYQSVQAIASSSTPLFTSLRTTWSFDPIKTSQDFGANPGEPQLDNSRTMVSFDLTYTFANPVYNSVSSAFFAQVSKQMIQAFEDRCTHIYGRK